MHSARPSVDRDDAGANPCPAALVLLLIAMAIGAPAGPAQAAARPAWLNPDGAFNYRAGFQGSLDLRGWQVSLDPRRGPLFAPQAGESWHALGSGVGDGVSALAVVGSTLYVGVLTKYLQTSILMIMVDVKYSLHNVIFE